MEYSKDLIEYLEQMAKKIRRNIVECIGIGNAGHLGGSCSSADIIAALYFYKMHFNKDDFQNTNRDHFLLSKGHAALVQYAALAEAGFFDREELKKAKSIGSMLQGHPDFRKTPGIEAGTGSLGQGLSIGLGMALGMKLDKIGRNVYVLIGDGEIAEGQIWEAAMAAGIYQSDNLIAILDNNGLQATGKIQERYNSYPFAPKWNAFGWNVIEIDGHDMEEIVEALDAADLYKKGPTLIIAHTIKGKGVGFAENVVGFHNGMLTEDMYIKALAEL